MNQLSLECTTAAQPELLLLLLLLLLQLSLPKWIQLMLLETKKVFTLAFVSQLCPQWNPGNFVIGTFYQMGELNLVEKRSCACGMILTPD